MKTRFAFVALLTILAGSAFATETYTLDPAHSAVTFCARHMMISTVCGKFKEFNATILLDPENVVASSWTGSIKVASITTDQERRDAHLKGTDFFDAEKYPEITFKSSKIEKGQDGYVAVGTLSMRGVSKEIRVPFTLAGPVDTGRGKKIGISADLTINRQDFGVSWNQKLDAGGVVVSDEIKVTLNAEAARQD